MADNTKIEWADATVNAVNGCSVVSPGCTNCYAMKQAHRFEIRRGLTVPSRGGMVWTGEVRPSESQLLQPLRWKRPRRIFWNAHGDLFHENVPDEWIDRALAVCALTPQHTHMILTKRSRRMREYFERHRWHIWASIGREIDAERWRNLPSIMGGDRTPIPNVWLGASVEDQARADERIPDLLATPAAVRFISAEPLLGPVDLNNAWHGEDALDAHCWGECNWCRRGSDFPPLWNCQKQRQSLDEMDKMRSGIDWVIVGGESGPSARPMHPDWARSLRDQCAEAGVPFFFKQWGEWRAYDAPHDDFTERDATGEYGNTYQHQHVGSDMPGAENLVIRVGKKAAGRLLDGIEHSDVPSTSARGADSAGAPA